MLLRNGRPDNFNVNVLIHNSSLFFFHFSSGTFGFLGKILIALLLLAFPCVQSVTGDTDEHLDTIQRLNYGTLFVKSGTVYPGQEHWRHTFEIPLPKKITTGETLVCNAPQCKTAQHILNTLNSLRTEAIASVNDTVHRIHQLIPKSTLPRTNPYFGRSRTKRGLFDFIGEFSKSLFGTATSGDINTLKRHMQTLNRNNAKLAKAMATQEKHLSSFIAAVDGRFENTMAAVQKNHQDSVMFAKEAQRSLDAVDHELVLLDEMILKQVNASARLNSELEHVKLGIHDLVKGKLSPFLITPHIIKTSIRQIQVILDTKFTSFHIIHKDPLYYYSFADFVYTRLHSTLYLTLKIPISSFAKPLLLYKVFSFPVPINASSDHATQLMSLPDYFLHTSDNQHFTTFSSSQLASCSGTVAKFCSYNVQLRSSASPSCLSSVFYNQKDNIKEQCDFRFLLNNLKPSIIELSPSHTLMYKISMVALDCKERQRIMKGCTFCVMKLPCLCSVTSDNLYLPPRLGNCNNNSDAVTVLHPVNLALLQVFFDSTAHSTIFGDTTFSNFVNLEIPQFKIYNHSISKYLANDQTYHLSLKRMADTARKDETVFRSLSESILAGQVDLALDAWPDTSGYIALASAGVGTLGIIFGVWSCIKVRKLSSALLLLHHSRPATALPTIPTVPSFVYSNLPEATDSKTISDHIYTSFTTPWPYVTLSVFTTLIIVVLAHILWSKFKRTHKTTLHIEITNGPNCALIPLTTLPLCPDNWDIQPPLDVSSVTLAYSGFIQPHLHIQCTEFTITNVHTQRSITVPLKVKVSWLKARKIRNVLQHPYSAYFILSHNGYYKLIGTR